MMKDVPESVLGSQWESTSSVFTANQLNLALQLV